MSFVYAMIFEEYSRTFACHMVSEVMELIPPKELNLTGSNIAENWRRWKHRFKLFSLASGLSEKDEKIQAATLLHIAGAEVLKVYNTFSWENNEHKKKVGNMGAACVQHLKPTSRRKHRSVRNRFEDKSTDL